MEMKTIRQFAEEQAVSYEAIRRQISSIYHEDLKDHIIKKGRTQYLDEFALEFLRKKRRENPVIVEVQDTREELDQLKDDNQALRNQIMHLQQQIINLQQEKTQLIEYKIKNDALLELHEKDKEQVATLSEELGKAKAEADTARAEADSARAEADSYKPSLFGFFRKKR